MKIPNLTISFSMQGVLLLYSNSGNFTKKGVRNNVLEREKRTLKSSMLAEWEKWEKILDLTRKYSDNRVHLTRIRCGTASTLKYTTPDLRNLGTLSLNCRKDEIWVKERKKIECWVDGKQRHKVWWFEFESEERVSKRKRKIDSFHAKRVNKGCRVEDIVKETTDEVIRYL